MAGEQSLGPAHEYVRDAWQRSILFLDVLRRRGNIYREQQQKVAPNVLEFDAELILDGRKLPRPVNYLLVRIVPPKGMTTDPAKRPFVVVDPRAGHGPGIGGMKDDSEIGAALKEGHPCYFIGFLPEPVGEQTVEDVWNAEAAFIRHVASLHPNAGKPGDFNKPDRDNFAPSLSFAYSPRADSGLFAKLLGGGTTPPTGWFYERAWQITTPASGIKQMAVTVTVRAAVGGAVPAVSTVVAVKASQF